MLFPSHIGSRSTVFYGYPFAGFYLVSIPHWFSLNHEYCQKRYEFLGFPSHIGSRSTKKEDPNVKGSMGFHPTLVLAQPIRQESELLVCSKFPSHIGSRSTVYQSVLSVREYVSIPHWFSLNSLVSGFPSILLGFHPTLVLAQQGSTPRGRVDEQVSIPHWFSLNLVLLGILRGLEEFPSHIGSRSTCEHQATSGPFAVSIPHWFSLNHARNTGLAPISTCFHPTLVLAQQCTSSKSGRRAGKFPSHIGSRSTGIEGGQHD